MPEEQIIIHTDGGSRGNPGPAAIGAVISFGVVKNEYGEYIGETTNNDAEYQALVLALKKAKQLSGKKKAKKMTVVCYADSELMVKQLNHQYKIQDERIQRWFLDIWNLMLDFQMVEFRHIPREKNAQADRLVNRVLDGQAAGRRS